MKTIFSIMAISTIAISAMGQQPAKNTTTSKGMGNKPVSGYSIKSCTCVASQQDNKIIVFRDGREVSDVTLSPGIKITADGLLKKEGGAERMLVDGNCVSEKGTITMQVK